MISSRRSIPPILRRTGVVAILRSRRAEHLHAVCETLVRTGVQCLELTTNTPGALNALAKLRETYGEAVDLGLGTVRSVSQVKSAAKAGLDFVVSPNTAREVGAAAADHGLAWYPGALTPTEIALAWDLGATAVKVFPADSAGGPRFLTSVLEPLDDVALIPTGGVRLDTIAAYIAAGAIGVGLGGPLIGDALESGNVAPVAERARHALSAAAGGKAQR